MSNPASYLTTAQKTLGMSSAQRGLSGMQRTAAMPGANALDSGAISKANINSQPSTNAVLQEQSIMQGFTSALPQKQAGALNQIAKEQAAINTADYAAERMRMERVAEVASVQFPNGAIAEMGRMRSPELSKAHNDIAVTVAQAQGVTPELMQNAMSANMYSA